MRVAQFDRQELNVSVLFLSILLLRHSPTYANEPASKQLQTVEDLLIKQETELIPVLQGLERRMTELSEGHGSSVLIKCLACIAYIPFSFDLQ